jgi:hypothetical protein
MYPEQCFFSAHIKSLRLTIAPFIDALPKLDGDDRILWHTIISHHQLHASDPDTLKAIALNSSFPSYYSLLRLAKLDPLDIDLREIVRLHLTGEIRKYRDPNQQIFLQGNNVSRDIWTYIFRFSDPRTLCRLAAVCKGSYPQWEKLISIRMEKYQL